MTEREQSWSNSSSHQCIGVGMNRYSLTGFVTLIILAFCLIACDIKLTSPGSYDAPTDLEIKKIEEGRVELSWKYPVSTEDTLQFVIAKRIGKGTWIETDSILVESPPFNFPDNILTNDSLIYAYKVKVHNVETDIYSQFSEVIAYLSPQTAPTDLNIVQTSQEKLKISWKDHCMGEDGYYVDKKMWDGSWTDKYRILAANSTSFVDSTNLFETVYYRVWVFVGESKKGGIENSIVPTLPAPDSLILSKPDPNKIKLSWLDKSSGEQGFHIDRKIGGMDWETEVASVDSNVTIWIDDISLPCGTFYYRVRAFCDTSYSWYSNEEHINIRLDIISSTNTPGEASDVYFYNWYAFIADKYSGLSIVNCVDPSNPEISTYNQGGLPDRTFSVFVRDEICYVSSHCAINDPGMFYMINVSPFINDPTLPLPSELFIIGNCETNGIPKDVFVFGDFAYIADGENGLSTILCTGPPHSISNISTNGDARNLFVQNSYAYIANGLNRGLVILDVSDPFNPIFKSNLPLEGLAQGIFVNGNYAYLANGENGLEIIDISDVNSPSLISNLDIQGFASSVFADDNYLYLTDKDNGFHVIDISDHYAPYILGTVFMTTQPVSVYLFCSYAFVADDEGLKIIQVLP